MARSFKHNKRRRPLSIDELQILLTDGIIEIQRLLLEKDSKPYLKIAAANALSSLASRYIPVIELTELAERIKKMEELIRETT